MSGPSLMTKTEQDFAMIREWLDEFTRCEYLDDSAADGGVTVAMVYQQQARTVIIPKLDRLATRANRPTPGDGAGEPVQREFNINDTVLVRLNDKGRAILRREHEDLQARVPNVGAWWPPKTDKDGYSRFQLWSLVKTFGPHISLGTVPPFDTSIRLALSLAEPAPDHEEKQT